MSTQLTPAQRAEVVRLWQRNRNWTIYRISRQTGFAWDSVKRALIKGGINPGARQRVQARKRKSAIATRNSEIRALAGRGRWSYAEIGRRFNLSRQRIFAIANGDGL